jgi:hypothetical protein
MSSDNECSLTNGKEERDQKNSSVSVSVKGGSRYDVGDLVIW